MCHAILLVAVTILPIILADYSSDICKASDLHVTCEFTVPKNPIADVSGVTYVGVSESECIDKMVRFKWGLAVYCEKSFFCDFGADLNRDYFSEAATAFAPLKEVCEVIVNRDTWNCDHLKETLFKTGILKKIDFTCLSHGNAYCEEKELRDCEDVEGGVVCTDCLQGAQTNSDGCSDIDECGMGLCGGPSMSTGCSNWVLSYLCTCRDGFQFDSSQYGSGCEDVDECLDTEICGANSIRCVNLEGSYTCECKEGYHFKQLACLAIPRLTDWSKIDCSCHCGSKDISVTRQCVWSELNNNGEEINLSSSKNGDNPCNNEANMAYTTRCSTETPCVVDEISLKTADTNGAKSDDNMYLTLYSSDSSCDIGLLDIPNFDDRRRASLDVHKPIKTCDVCLAKDEPYFRSLTVTTDGTDGWIVEYIAVKVNQQSTRYTTNDRVDDKKTITFKPM